MNTSQFLEVLQRVLGAERWPKPLHCLQGLKLIWEGAALADAAKRCGTTVPRLRVLAASDSPITDLLGLGFEDLSSDEIRDTRRILGQLLLGQCAERAFEEIY